ncbi:MAG: hypothetical protein II566_05680 [Lachnospiraceae bacterium]|nr:hypothetical protein [Lachnospiraceae bacterium]
MAGELRDPVFCAGIDYSRPSRTNLAVKAKFHAIRLLQKNNGKKDPEYRDYKYWKQKGWLDGKRLWKR